MLSHNYAGDIPMRHDTIHDYTFSDDARVHWHECCGEPTLAIAQYLDGQHQRVMITNVSRKEIVRFAKEILEDSYNLELKADVTDKELVT
jgi:hypothetical protein